MWIDKYLGKRWTQEQDCGYWFRRIQKEQFNRDIPAICNAPNESRRFMVQAMRLLRDVEENSGKLGWGKTDSPVEGDAALLAMRAHIHHIGIVVFMDDQLHVLHALEQCGVMISSKTNLKLNFLQIKGFFTYGD